MKKPSKPSAANLSHDDVEIWRRVARTVNAYKPVPKPIPKLSPKAIVKGHNFNKTKSFVPTPRAAPVKQQRSLRLKPAPQIAADKSVRRGKVKIDRKIDLHDMTQDQAYSALLQCLHGAANRGQSCVLVVTGKGSVSQSLYGGGVLRRMFPIWLESPDIRPLIGRYAQAHIRHGGSGAWYVFLKTNY